MSGQNSELVRDAFAAYQAGDSERFAAFFADNTLMTGPEGWPESGPFEDKEAVLRQFERLASDWQEHHFSDLAVVADERNWVVMEYRWHTRGAASGIETVFDMASAHRMEDGRQAEAHFRWKRAEALKAAGLSE
jgi:ketosteroid isomerase-like protein